MRSTVIFDVGIGGRGRNWCPHFSEAIYGLPAGVAGINFMPEADCTFAVLPTEIDLLPQTQRPKIKQTRAQILEFSARCRDPMYEIIEPVKVTRKPAKSSIPAISRSRVA